MTLQLATDGILQDRWAVPIYQMSLDPQLAGPVNHALREEILRREREEEHLTIGVAHAVKVARNLLLMDDPAVFTLQGWILDAVHRLNRHALGGSAESLDQQLLAEAWAVVYRRNGYHRVHAHPGSAWSGVYYVHCPGDGSTDAGAIEFFDPRPAALAVNWDPEQRTHRRRPRPGMLLAFPSWLQHTVLPVDGDEERICVAFNVGFQGHGDAHAQSSAQR